MDPEEKKFGRGPRELTGAVDLISHYKLVPHHEFFCKRSLPLSISDSHYLHNVVGDTEIRKGEGMQLDQLIQSTSYSRDITASIKPFDLDTLREAFQFRDTSPIDLPANLSQAEKGIPTFPGKSKSEAKDKERKHKKHKDRDKDKDREHKKHRHRHKDRSKEKDKDKEKKKDRSEHPQSGTDHSKKNHDKKRKHNGDEETNDIHRHKKSKNKSSKFEEVGAIKVAG